MFEQGAIVMGVVIAVGEGGEKSWKNSSVMGTKVGIEKDTSGLVRVGEGCETKDVN